MESFARLFPFVATAVAGLAHAIAFRAASPASTWAIMGGTYALLAAIAAFLLHREELLKETFTIVPGDISRGIGAAAVGVLVVAGVGLAAVHLAPFPAFEEMRKLVGVVVSVKPEVKRAALIVAIAVAEELVFRGAVTVLLEERFGSARAPWVASGLYALAVVPSLRPSLIGAGLVVGAITAFVVARFRRTIVAMVAHAAFTWVAIELVLPFLWQRATAVLTR